MTMALEGSEGSASRPGHSLPPGKTQYPLYRRLGVPQGRSGQVRKISLPTGNQSPDRPARSSVAIPTELPSPQKRFIKCIKCVCLWALACSSEMYFHSLIYVITSFQTTGIRISLQLVIFTVLNEKNSCLSLDFMLHFT
jgi:hypothetical protein